MGALICPPSLKGSNKVLTIKKYLIMFITYCKDVDGKKYDRYFKTWKSAENALQDGLKDVLSLGGKELTNKDYFSIEKGVQIRYVVLITDAHKYTLSLFASFFEDD